MAAKKQKLFRFLEDLVFPSDRVAFALDGKLIKDFTNDLASIKEAFGNVILRSKRRAVDFQQRAHAGHSGTESGQSSFSQILARQEALLSTVEARNAEEEWRIALLTLARFVRAMGVLPGRKHLIGINRGMPSGPQYTDLIEKIISAANRAGVSVRGSRLFQ